MQKISYVYGWTDFLEDTDDIDDETLGKLTAFLGVMMGVGGASTMVTGFAANVARPAIQKQIAGVALTKTAWYTPMKQVLRVVGIKLTKDGFAKTVAKTVPVAGGILSGGLTYATLRVQSVRLIKHLRQLPPPNVDSEEYLRVLHSVDEAEEERSSRTLRGRVASAASTFSSPRPAVDRDDDDEPSPGTAAGTVKGAATRVKGAAAATSGRVGSLLARRSVGKASEVHAES